MFDFKEFRKRIGLKLIGEPLPQESYLIKVYKNNNEICIFNSATPNINDFLLKIIEFLARCTKYEINFNLRDKEIYINFIIKKALEDKKNKEE